MSSNGFILERNFDIDGKPVYTVFIDEEPWFRNGDVCRGLGHTDARQAIKKHVSIENKVTRDALEGWVDQTHPLPKPKNSQPHEYYINEAGLYELTFGSTLLEAIAFKKHVYSVILPEIRKTGKYELTQAIKCKDRRHQLAIEDHRVAIQQKDSHIALLAHNEDIANGIIRARDMEIENLRRNRHVPLSGRGYDEVFIIVKKNSDYDELYPLYLICRQKRGTRQALLKLRKRYPHLDILTQFDTPNSIHRWNEIKQRNPAVIQWSDRHFRILNPDIELEMFALTDGVVG